MYENCKNHEETLLIIKTKFGKIIGMYNEAKIEKTERKSILGKKQFYFYFNEEDLKIIKRKDGTRFEMASNNEWFIGYEGIAIKNDRNENDSALCSLSDFNIPGDIGYAIKGKADKQ